MGAWSAAILGNDTSCEVYERFIELYNFGEPALNIESIVLQEQKENLECDKTNVWFGLALACWECKVLKQETLSIVRGIINSNEDLDFCKELDAADAFLKQRSKNLNAFLGKISSEKEKPRVRKKPHNPIESSYKAGMCLSYKNDDGNYIGVYVTKSEHFKNKGEIKFCFLDFESKQLPGIKMFENAKLIGLKKLGKEWRFAEYCGNVTSVNYDKAEKEDFFNSIPQVFTLIGELGIADSDKLINNFSGYFTDLSKPDDIIKTIEKPRVEFKTKYGLSDITLEELLDKVALE